MKRLLVTALCLLCAGSLSLNAAAGKKKELTDEQKKVQKEMLDKYDTNKDGKLDKTERAKISQEDKDKMSKAGLGGRKRPAQ